MSKAEAHSTDTRVQEDCHGTDHVVHYTHVTITMATGGHGGMRLVRVCVGRGVEKGVWVGK